MTASENYWRRRALERAAEAEAAAENDRALRLHRLHDDLRACLDDQAGLSLTPDECGIFSRAYDLVAQLRKTW